MHVWMRENWDFLPPIPEDELRALKQLPWLEALKNTNSQDLIITIVVFIPLSIFLGVLKIASYFC